MNLPPGFRSKVPPGFPWRSRAPGPGWLLLSLLVFILSSYFLYMPAQREVESRFASQFARRLEWYPLEFPDSPITNLAQLLYGVQGGYPYAWHEWFRLYGSDAGFARSLEEKFVLAPPGVFHRAEIYCLSAQPFPVYGEPHRMVIYTQTNNCGSESVSERRIQEAFQRAGKVIPVPARAAPPPPPPASTSRNANPYYLSAWLETRGGFSQLEWSGCPPLWARVIEGVVGWGLVIICASSIGYCLWPVPSRNREEEPLLLAGRTTAQKVWTVIGCTVLFFLFVGCASPWFGSDRGFGELWFHLLLPYSAAWEAMPHQEPRYGTGLLLLLQIVIYDLALGYAWIRNRLGLVAIILAAIHVFAIALSINGVLTRRW